MARERPEGAGEQCLGMTNQVDRHAAAAKVHGAVVRASRGVSSNRHAKRPRRKVQI